MKLHKGELIALYFSHSVARTVESRMSLHEKYKWSSFEESF